MKRARAESLVLVNWKGVFYERYTLDPHVTALEGDNGAGKTTVMIAAYTVLLPDMTRLRFSNLGESGATGGDKGLWGRLGEPGRPSYAALVFRLPTGARLLAGVQLVRKAEPSVEPTPFVVTELPEGAQLQDLFLLSRDGLQHVPELSELKESFARAGARVEVCRSLKDYFATLFDHHIMPLRLENDEERNKFNEMLKTSMTGGMSRGLLSELRSFLLRPEGTLADTLQRMRANLDACRRTRTEVREAQTLEREIGAIYEASEAMFAAAITASRRRAEEARRRVEAAAAEELRARERQGVAEGEFQSAVEALDRIKENLEGAEERERQADSWMRRVDEALRLAGEVELCQRATEALARDHMAIAARHRAATARLADERAQLEQAQETRERAAAGLADLEKGLSELHRRADLHRRITARRAEAEEKLARGPLELDRAHEVRREEEERLVGVDTERRALRRRIDDAEAHRVEHAAALAALEEILAGPGRAQHAAPHLETGAPHLGTAYEQAKNALERVREWRHRAAGRPELKRALAELETLAQRQAAARGRGAELGVDGRAGLERAFEEIEAAIDAEQGREKSAATALERAARGTAEADAEVARLEPLSLQYQALNALRGTLEAALEVEICDRESLHQVRKGLVERHHSLAQALQTTRARRESLMEEARTLRSLGGNFPAALLRARDALTAELLATHFEDVSVEDAAELEARLGPLSHALLVSDLEAATQRLQSRSPELDTVWLVDEETSLMVDLESGRHRIEGGDAIVDQDSARRITRVPTQPTLGYRARLRRAEQLDAEAESLAPQIRERFVESQRIEGFQRDADALLEGIGVLLAEDPAVALEASRVEGAAQREALAIASRSVQDARVALDGLSTRRAALLALLPSADLLEPPDYAPRAVSTRQALEAAEHSAACLAAVGEAPLRLEAHLDALRTAPLSATEVEEGRRRLLELERRRDRSVEGLDALEEVVANRIALQWHDAEERLRAERGLVPELKAQLETAIAEVERSKAKESLTRDEHDVLSQRLHQVVAQLEVSRSQLTELGEKLSATEVDDPTPPTRESAQSALREAHAQCQRLRVSVAASSEQIGRRELEVEGAERAHRLASAELEEAESQARPDLDGWERLRPLAESSGVFDAPQRARFDQRFGEQNPIALWTEAQHSKTLLVERLQHANSGKEALDTIAALFSGGEGERRGEVYLAAWLAIRDWLRRRVPAQIAEVDEPLVALSRLREKLGGLEERLERQERDLRGASQDVANHIKVQIRRARKRITRLNTHLTGVRFGSICAIRVRCETIERMDQVLRALGEGGGAQQLLFQSDLPIEEALEEIFKRYGGGRTGGEKLLDYREYLRLEVEIQRHDSVRWEPASPTRLSTGEAIGVGATLMMVVLTEWEKDATLLRGKRQHGSLRFLFLDEANRLDQANLATIFELCRPLELQLLVAAPEVARAEGCTVFRLVRTRDAQGREEVKVSGRRLVSEVQ